MLQATVKTVLHPYTRISWVNPSTGRLISEIFDVFEGDAAMELEENLQESGIEYDKDILRPC